MKKSTITLPDGRYLIYFWFREVKSELPGPSGIRQIERPNQSPAALQAPKAYQRVVPRSDGVVTADV